MKVLFAIVVIWVFSMLAMAGVDVFFMEVVGHGTEILWLENGIISLVIILILVGISKIKK
jgi:hypothetical protein